jgi:TonB-linked SusC/RagA family outer membrane protein
MNLNFTEPGCSEEPRSFLQRRPTMKFLMRVGLFFVFFALLSIQLLLAHSGRSQALDSINVTVELRNENLTKLFKIIEKQTGLMFAYQPEQVNDHKSISMLMGTRSVKATLDIAFQGTPLKYRQVNNSVIIFSEEEGKFKMTTEAPAITVSGKVSNAEGSPVPGVNILVKATTNGTTTDAEGMYSLVVPEEDAVLVFSFIGYTTQEVPVNGRSVIDVILTEDIQNLQEVVVVGYGTQKKSDVTGSVASIHSKDFVKGVATNALQLLSGKASGVSINQVNSEPGGDLTIRVRGAGSINSSNSVLVVIDGLPGGSVANINPSDIESIEILKDASAAAIYGARAANGVVLITTRKGKVGAPQVSYDTYWAYQTPSHKLDVLNATQYMQMINDISNDAGKTLPYSNEQIAAAGKGTDWQDELFRNASATNHQISISGGDQHSKYYTSLGYLSQDGIMVSSAFKKYNVLLNLESNPSQKFKVGINVSGNVMLKDRIANESNLGNENADPLNAALMFDPRISPNKNENGEYETNPSIALDNPVALAYGYDYRNEDSRIYGNVFGEYEIIDGLSATFRMGGDINNSRNDEYSDRTTQRGKANGGIGNVTSSNLKYWLAEGLLKYDKTFGDHRISLLGGSTWEKFERLSQRSYGSGFLSDVTNTNLLQSGNALNNEVSSSKSVYKLQSFIGRANYAFMDRYLLTATVRRDGTSRFSAANKFAIFPSVAVGWRVAEEGFLKDVRAISNLKLKFGYGRMGNEGIGNFETISTFVAGGNTVLGGKELSGAQPARIRNPGLTWETTEEYNYGLDFGFFEDRISGNIEYYVKNSIDQLFSKPVPMSTGFSNIRTNFGTVRNSGIDFSLNTHNLTGKFQWTTGVMLSTLRNEVVELPPYVGDIITGGIVANIPGFALVRQGYPMRAFYGYQVTGIFQVGDDIANSAQPTAKPGEPIFLDYDRNNKIDASDRIVLGDPFPDLMYSFNNAFSYKNFNLEIYFLGVKGIETFNANVLESMFPINFDRNIMTEHYVNRWTPENPDAQYPSGVNSATYFGGGKMINSYTVQDASYLRLKNVTLSYNIPLNDFKLFKSVLLSLSGENLLTFTDFHGYDPESNQTGDGTSVAKASYNNYPTARTFRIGANINF